jgi:hypothetical protein
MKLPNASKVVVAIEKLEGYCLNPYHDKGKHKARVFMRALGIGMEHATILKQALLYHAMNSEAIEINSN